MGKLSNKVKNSYAIAGASTVAFSPVDGASYCFGVCQQGWETNFGQYHKVIIPITGAIKAARCYWYANTLAGSSEAISVYIRVGNTTDTLVQTVSDGNAGKGFLNSSLNIAVTGGTSYFEIKVVCPTWATNPTGVYFNWIVYIE